MTEIKARQSLVELFWARPALLTDLRELLKDVEDATRISQKFLLGRGTIDDLISIRDTIDAWETIRGLLSTERAVETLQDQGSTSESWICFDQLMSRMTNLKRIAERISLAVECDRSSLSMSSEGEEEEAVGGQSSNEANSDEPKAFSFYGLDMKWTIRPQ